MATNEAPKLDLHQFVSDIKAAAVAAEVPYNEAMIWQNLGAYEEYFQNGAAGLRTTTKPREKRDLSVRYLEPLKLHDPFAIALEKGLLTRQGHPIEGVIPECQARLPLSGYGCDFSVSHGFDKIWPFFIPAVSIEEISAMPSMPPAVKNYAGHFARFDLKWVSLLALDYWNKTANIYFMIKDPTPYPPERIAAMIADLGFQVPAQEELELNSKTVCIYHTFSWESAQVERLCYVLAGPEEHVPTRLHPVLDRFVKNVPIMAASRQFTWNTTYANRGGYLKIEADYTGTMGAGLGAAIAAVPN